MHLDFLTGVVRSCKLDDVALAVGVSATELLEEAAKRGWPVSDQKLERWIKAGLFVRGRRPGLGRGQGRGVTMFPVGSAAHIFRLCELTQQRVTQEELGWQLWWEGYPVAPKFWRKPLEKAALDWDRALGDIRHEFGTEDRMDVSENAHITTEQSFGQKNQTHRQVHRRLTSAGQPSFNLAMMRVAAGCFAPSREWSVEDDGPRENEEILKGFGLGNGMMDNLRHTLGQPTMTEAVEAVLMKMAKDLKGKSAARELQGGGHIAVELARAEINQLRHFMSSAVSTVQLQSGKAAASLNTLRLHLSPDRKLTMAHLLIWICLGETSDFRMNVRAFIAESACPLLPIAADSAR